MFFGFGTPFFFILPLIFFVVLVRVASGFFRGLTRRRPPDDLPDFLRPRVGSADMDQNAVVPRPARRNNTYESQVFRLALKLKGRVTVSDVVIETGLSLQEAEDVIESMVDSVHVRMEVDDQGRVVYEFPEIIRRVEDEG